MLNDLFGIQARGGCSCAGPYGHRLLGIDLDRSHLFQREIDRGCEGIKPGWTRVNFNYFISDTVRDYLIDAVALIADQGVRLLPDYRFDAYTGLWHHRAGHVEPPLRLRDLTYDADGAPCYPQQHDRAPETALQDYLKQAAQLMLSRPDPPQEEGCGAYLSAEFEALRWFRLPVDCMR